MHLSKSSIAAASAPSAEWHAARLLYATLQGRATPCSLRPTQVDFGIRATFWVDSRRGGGRVGSRAPRAEDMGLICRALALHGAAEAAET